MDISRRILIIPSWYPPDGGYFFKEHSEAIRDKGWEVDVLVNRVVGLRKMMQVGLGALKRNRIGNENGLRVIRSVYLKIPGNEELNIRRWSQKVLQLYGRYQKNYSRPDLILTHSVTWAGYAASLIKERHGIPYVVVEHRSFFVWSTPEARNMVKSYHLPYFKTAYHNCERLIPVSESLMRGLKELMPWIEQKTVVIPNMIREDMFLPPERPRSTDPFVYFWAGRLEHVKGIDILLEGIRMLRHRTSSPFSVRLAGRGSLRSELEQQAEGLGLSDLVTFLGRISREEVQREMQGASCFILPTRYEAFGAVLIEAMATGLPVIATRSGGPDSIVSSETGLLIDTEDPGQLAEAMEHMILDWSAYSQEAIRTQAVEKYGQTNVMEQYHQLFIQILAQ